MDDREFFCKRHRAEYPTFKRVLEAMPLDQFAYRPHERSPSALDLVWTLAGEMAACATMIDGGEVHWTPLPPPPPREASRPSTRITKHWTNARIVLRRKSGKDLRSSMLVVICSWSSLSAAFCGTCFSTPFTTEAS
jgi:hypothetical protein